MRLSLIASIASTLLLIACEKKVDPPAASSAAIVAAPVPKAADQPKRPSASEVCTKIEASGIGKRCHEVKPEGLGAAAVERFDFDLPSVPGKGGSVMRFDRESFFDNTEESYGRMAQLAGPHRYGSKKALIFVQANEKLSLEDGRKLKVVVDGL